MLYSENVYTNLNYAVFLYNQGDRQGAASRLITFRKNFDSIVQGKRRDIDPEVKINKYMTAEFIVFNIYKKVNLNFFSKLQEISAKLGPILNVGETSNTKPKPIEPPQSPTPYNPGESAQKYTNISKDGNDPVTDNQFYTREPTLASVSNVDFGGDGSSSRPVSTLGSSRPSTSTSSTADLKKKFGNLD